MLAVITKHEIASLRHNVRTIIAGRCFRYMTVCFFVLFAVDKDFAVFDLNGVSRKADQSFDKELALIIRIFEDDDVVTLRIFHFLGNMSSEEVKINAICHTETEDTVTGHDRLLHRFRRDLCVDKNYIVYDQNYDDHDDEHFDVVPDFIPDFHNNFSPNFSSFMIRSNCAGSGARKHLPDRSESRPSIPSGKLSRKACSS